MSYISQLRKCQRFYLSESALKQGSNSKSENYRGYFGYCSYIYEATITIFGMLMGFIIFFK